MKIQIDGTNTLNKGAELMFYAVLEQVENRYPEAIINYNTNYAGESRLNISTSLKIEKRRALHLGKYPAAILRRLKLPYTYFSSKHPLEDIDVVLDAAGFQFSDQWNYSDESLNNLERYYKNLKKTGAKIIFLPQALGPFKTNAGIRTVNIVSTYANLIFAREKISYQYFLDAGGNKEKILTTTDFTLLVKGSLPEKYKHLEGNVCIIPNKKMVTHAENDSLEYITFLEKVIQKIQNRGKQVFILNHEGKGDLKICNKINSRFKNKLEVVTGLNAKEVKAVIGISSFVISSRFHGVASALNQGIPCLATSWNHKYEMLFNDFGQKNRILQIENDITLEFEKIDDVFNNYIEIKETLLSKKEVLIQQVEDMWNSIWQLIEKN